MRFLHLADVHLDTPFAGRSPELRGRLRQASREALAAAIQCALEEAVDAVLVAGDLFDGERLSFGTELFLLEQVRRLEAGGIPLIYACGNHDPGGGGPRDLAWPANVSVAGDRRPRRFGVAGPDGRTVGFVTAAGHGSDRETDDLSRLFPPPPAELPEVALLHTQVVTASARDPHHPYAPSRLSALLRSGYHYWALGHVHQRQCLSEAPAVHYPGNPQGRTPAERGPRGGLLVDLQEPTVPRVEFRPFGPVRFETVEVRGLEGEPGAADLAARVVRAWEAAREGDAPTGADWIVRVVLSGPTPLARELADPDERATLAEGLREALGVLDVDVWARNTHPVPRPGDHRQRQDVLGESLRAVESLLRGDALPAGLDPRDLVGHHRDRSVPDYVRSLLDGAEAELVVRLLKEP